MLFYTLFFLVAGYLLLCLGVYAIQDKLLFHPKKGGESTPGDLGLEFEELRFESSPGVFVRGWYVPVTSPDADAPVVLFCHGNAGNLTHRLETIRLIHGMGLNLLIFDYQGYGLSQGKPGEEATYSDVDAAWNLLTREKGIRPERIIVWGRSLGGAVAAWCAQRHTPCALVLESTFTSVPDMGARIYPFFPVRILCRLRYDTLKLLASIRCPLLVVHSPDDSVVPYGCGQQLYAAANEPKHFLTIQGDHNDGFLVSQQHYTAGIANFIQSFCPRGIQREQS